MAVSLSTPINAPISTVPIPTAKTTNPGTLQQAIPGLDNLTSSATGDINNLLSGSASPSWARTTNAYYGAGTGQPGTGGAGTFIGNRGADLYHQQAMGNEQTGLQDLLALVGGYSGTVAPSAGQTLQNSQFYSSLANQANEFNSSNALDWARTLLPYAMNGQGGGSQPSGTANNNNTISWAGQYGKGSGDLSDPNTLYDYYLWQKNSV